MADKIKFPSNIYTVLLVFAFVTLVGGLVYTGKRAHELVGNTADVSGMAPVNTCWMLINPDVADPTSNIEVQRVIPDPTQPVYLKLKG